MSGLVVLLTKEEKKKRKKSLDFIEEKGFEENSGCPFPGGVQSQVGRDPRQPSHSRGLELNDL